MMLFKNFRIRRHLCRSACAETATTLVVVKYDNNSVDRRYYCAEHAVAGVYWAQFAWPHTHKIYRDTGARTQ